MNKLTFIVVDDDVEVCTGIIEKMKSHLNWATVGHAQSPKKTIALIEQHHPDLIFLDWDLMGGNAFEVLDVLKSKTDYYPYIIFNTAHFKQNIEISEKVVNEYKIDKLLCIGKPIFGELFEKIDALVLDAEQKIFSNTSTKNISSFWFDSLEENTDIHNLNFKYNKIRKLKNIEDIMAIEISENNSRLKKIHFENESKPLIIKANWDWCCQLLEKYDVDYFITNFRESLIIRNYITEIDLPIIKIKGINTGFKIVQDKKNDFENWLNKIN
jgi:CheY-like chemotaxis protein